MKKRRYLFGLLSTILSVGFLFGCNDKKDEAEPDPTEEPSEQKRDEAEPDPTEEPSEQKAENDRNNGPQDVRYQPDRDRNDNLGDNNQTRLEVANDAEDRVVKLDEVDSANVIVTNRNAYVAVVLKNGAKGEVTDRLEKKIADQVRDTDPDIRDVFVSSNPDFVKRMTDYGNRINEGDPIEGLFEEFTETTRRVFPNVR
ncbi:YhcN/YlaJ family sporulation lipoprotein [Priestia endophytica]|uniref:YhcN/YlaJ family sporulation lipoprotein n=1 Tax=Priestia endophytica TaxID=135735 RepID=UPI0022810D34|nr:YhcN/YlaJ family sporulation lipoprotein [Priestia endophytica]MCY8235375.1 YhcN/YlaJ family sporulation lipoprotein [Priestia endophytica]